MSIAKNIISAISSAIRPITTGEFIRSQPNVAGHSVRARLHELSVEGLIGRVGKGLYIYTGNGVRQVGAQTDSLQAVKAMADAGFQPDCVFLDVPYGAAEEGAGVKGGNRDLAPFPVLHSGKFAGMATDLARMMAPDAPVVLIISNGKTSAKAKAGYMAALAGAGFQLAAQGSYTKTDKKGKPVQFMGRVMPAEGIFIYTLSGRYECAEGLELVGVRPSSSDYPTRKASSMLCSLFEAITRPGAMILDPFGGSGSTAVACNLIGRNSISFDILHNPVAYAGL